MTRRSLTKHYPAAANAGSDHVTLAFLGFMSTKLSHRPVINAARVHGDVIVGRFQRHGFNPEAVITAVIDQAVRSGYREVTVLGASMGGPISLAAIEQVKAAGLTVRRGVVISGLAGFGSIAPSARRIVQLCGPRFHLEGWMRHPFNALMTFCGWPLMATVHSVYDRARHGRSVVEPGTSRLRLWCDGLSNYGLSWSARASQFRFLASHQFPVSGQIHDVKLTYVESLGDHLVLPHAVQQYLRHFGTGEIVKTTLPHCSFAKFPAKWEEILIKALRPSPN